MRNPRSKISLSPGDFKGISVTKHSNYKQNMKAPKLGGDGIPATKKIANALGVSVGMPVHQNAVKQLMSHPDNSVVAEAKKLMRKY